MIRRLPLFLAGSVLLTGCFKGVHEWESERVERSVEEMARIAALPALPDHPLCLKEVIDIAIERNLPLRVRSMEAAVQEEMATGAKLAMLPDLNINGQWSERSNLAGATSQSLTNRPPAPPSFSSERQRHTWDATLTWNILDFGISYFRARQAANQGFIAQMHINRERHKLVLDVATAYWRALASHRALQESQEVLGDADNMEHHLKTLADEDVVPDRVALTYRDKIIKLRQRVLSYQQTYRRTLSELKQLMGVSSSTALSIHDDSADLEIQFEDQRKLENMALVYRPEMLTVDLEEKISADEVWANLIDLFPSLSLFGSAKYDENRFLIHNSWLEAGARTSWFLLDLPNKWKRYEASKISEDQKDFERLATAMAVLTQLNMARVQYEISRNAYEVSREAADVRNQLLKIYEKQESLGQLAQLDTFDFRYDALIARADLYSAYANLMISLEQVNSAIGVPGYYGSAQLCELAPSERIPAIKEKPYEKYKATHHPFRIHPAFQ